MTTWHVIWGQVWRTEQAEGAFWTEIEVIFVGKISAIAVFLKNH